jgi:hypothetical protein
MKTDRPQACEIKIDGVWRVVSLEDAHMRYRVETKRCPVCHGQMSAYGGYTAAARRILAHRRKHAGCSLNPETYPGTPSLHPQALT